MDDGSPRPSMNPSGYFIDDYSHLRLSYYQHHGAISELSCDESSSTRDSDMKSNLTMNTSLDTNLDNTWTGNGTDKTQDSSVIQLDSSSDHHDTSSLFPQDTSPSSNFGQDMSSSIIPPDTSLFQPSSSSYQKFDDISISDLKYEDGSTQYCLSLEEPYNNTISKKYQAIPPPMFTMASMMGSISNSMNAGTGMFFKYNDTIESNPGKARSEYVFSPQRRSTLIPTKKQSFQ